MENYNPMVTKLEDLGINNNDNIEPCFIISEKKIYMFNTCNEYIKKKALPLTTDIPCFYCTEPFKTQPLGVPINYVPSYVLHKFKSAKDDSVLYSREIISSEKKYEQLKNQGYEIEKNDYYEVEGNFCSFNCMISFTSLRKSVLEIKPLISSMYYSMYKTTLNWEPAPDIRLLKKFGGHLTISMFRSEEGRSYKITSNKKIPEYKENEEKPKYIPCSYMFQYTGKKLD